MAGVSGTTERFVQMAEYFNLSVVNTRLAMYGHLISIHAHSYHEISTAAKGHGGLTYTPGDYTNIPPLADSWERERRAKISRPDETR